MSETKARWLSRKRGTKRLSWRQRSPKCRYTMLLGSACSRPPLYLHCLTRGSARACACVPASPAVPQKYFLVPIIVTKLWWGSGPVRGQTCHFCDAWIEPVSLFYLLGKTTKKTKTPKRLKCMWSEPKKKALLRQTTAPFRLGILLAVRRGGHWVLPFSYHLPQMFVLEQPSLTVFHMRKEVAS